MVQIHVPEDLGGKLKVLPETQVDASIQDVFLGTSGTGNPKATVKWIITEEVDKKLLKTVKEYNDLDTTVGENVLETFSLLPNALWNLNDLFEGITGDRIPANETGFSTEEFEALCKESLTGGEARLDLENADDSGEMRTQVKERAYKV